MANNQNLRPWKPGQSGNPAGGNRATREVHLARSRIREFLLRDGGLEQLLTLTAHKDPLVCLGAYRLLMAYGIGKPVQEIRVERHASTVSLHVAAVANPEKYAALEEARAKVQALLLDGKEAGNGAGRDADG